MAIGRGFPFNTEAQIERLDPKITSLFKRSQNINFLVVD